MIINIILWIFLWPFFLMIKWFDKEHLSLMKEHLSEEDYAAYVSQYPGILELVNQN